MVPWRGWMAPVVTGGSGGWWASLRGLFRAGNGGTGGLAPTGASPLDGAGGSGLRLLLDPQSWIHRRVETVSFPPNGETRRRVSWDFTLPTDAVIPASRGRVVVPLTLLRKQPLKRLDVHDEAGTSLPVWGAEENGHLALTVLASGLAGLQGSAPDAGQLAALDHIVRAPNSAFATDDIDAVFFPRPEKADEWAVLRALAEELADNFILVVELAEDVVGRRALVKMTYDDELGGAAARALRAGYATTVKGEAWSGAASWHLEVHAPEGLAVDDLSYESWDSTTLDLLDFDETTVTGHTAHITGSRVPSGARTDARLVIRPARVGLVNQTLVATWLAWALVTLGCLTTRSLVPVLMDADRAGSLAGVTLAVPAFLVALMARSQEHELASRVLLVPRMLNAATAAVLLAGAAALVLGLHESDLAWALRALFFVQGVLAMWAFAVWRSVGGGT